MRILSLLPSATEIVYALGLEDDLIGVTHECDWPPEARSKRSVSFSTLEPTATPGEIDRLVSTSIDGGEPIYRLDTEAVRELRPDLVISQDLCKVCAVPSGHVNEALDHLGCSAAVLSLDPSSLEDVFDCIVDVGLATGTEAKARSYVDGLKNRLQVIEDAMTGVETIRTFGLEWSDPPFNAGHWVPYMIEAAGGDDLLASRGSPSKRLSWEEIENARPEVVVFMPCGYDLDAAIEEGKTLVKHPALTSVGQVFAVDATAYFSRPGPRLVDGVEILASLLHPEALQNARKDGFHRLR